MKPLALLFASILSTLLLLGLSAPLAQAQLMPGMPSDDGPADPAPVVASEQSAPVPAARRHPRATLLTFLDAMNRVAGGEERQWDVAFSCLDLSEIDAIVRDELAPEIARDLKEAIDRIRWVSPNGYGVPDDPDGGDYVFEELTAGQIVIARSEDGHWRFSSSTVADAEVIFDAVKDRDRKAGVEIELRQFSRRWWREQVPEVLRAKGFLLEHWQWIFLLAIVFLGIVADKLTVLVLRFLAGRVARRGHVSLQQNTLRSALRPFGLLAMGLVWLRLLPQPGLDADSLLFLKVAVEFVVALAAVWGVYRLIDVLGDYLAQWAEGTESALDDLLVPLAMRTLKVFVFAMGIVFLADQLRLNVAGLLTGLGLGGLAFALAAQDLVKNLFGSVMVIADRTFQVGDWIVVGDVEGSIETVGFRSTKVRTFYNSLITVPNSTFISASVDNLGKRRYRRWKTNVALTYDTPPERIEAFCEGIRELVLRHPYTRKDYFQVYLNGFAASSLDVLVYVFHECPDWSTELRERERLMLDIIRLAKQLGVEFAFPTQTLHIAKDDEQQAEANSEPTEHGAFTEVNQSKMRGRAKARQIVKDFHLDGERPLPVRIEIPNDEDRGEG